MGRLVPGSRTTSVRRTAALALALALGSGVAHADRPASKGWFAEGGLGVVGFLPGASDDAAVGPAMNVRVGLDLFSWLSLGVSVAASSHEATVPAPPDGE